MSEEKKEVYVVYESLIQCLVNDLITFSFICGSVFFNIKFCGGSYFLNAVILILFLMFVISKSNYKKILISKELVGLVKDLHKRTYKREGV